MENELLHIKSRYYSVADIKKLEHCGKDRAYLIAKELPHEKRGRNIYVFAEDYDNYYQEKRQKALGTEGRKDNIYKIRKFGG